MRLIGLSGSLVTDKNKPVIIINSNHTEIRGSKEIHWNQIDNNVWRFDGNTTSHNNSGRLQYGHDSKTRNHFSGKG